MSIGDLEEGVTRLTQMLVYFAETITLIIPAVKSAICFHVVPNVYWDVCIDEIAKKQEELRWWR